MVLCFPSNYHNWLQQAGLPNLLKLTFYEPIPQLKKPTTQISRRIFSVLNLVSQSFPKSFRARLQLGFHFPPSTFWLSWFFVCRVKLNGLNFTTFFTQEGKREQKEKKQELEEEEKVWEDLLSQLFFSLLSNPTQYLEETSLSISANDGQLSSIVVLSDNIENLYENKFGGRWL